MAQKQKLKVLRIKDVVIDESVYPRINVDWVTTARYLNALKSGANFPPIVVALLDGKYILVDGGHRLKAYEANKETHIQAEVLEDLDMKAIYIEAVKRNSEHGRQFSTQEVTKICITLTEWGESQEVISELVRIPTDKITPFVAKRMTRIAGTGQEIPLKATIKHFADVDFQEPINQKAIMGGNQKSVLETFIRLMENNWINLEDKAVITKLKKIRRLLELKYSKLWEKPKKDE